MKDAPNKRMGLIMAIILLVIISACQSAPPSPTLEPTWGIQGTIYPATIQAYVNEVHLGQATRIEFTHPVSHEQVVITTQSMIQSTVELLDSPMDHCTGTPESTDYALLLSVTVQEEGGYRHISMDYRPVTNDVLLDNIPTGFWPVKIQGKYSVCPNFGKSLFELLGIDASRQPPPVVPTVSPTAGIQTTIPAKTPTVQSSSTPIITPTPSSQEEIQLPVQTPSMIMGKGNPTSLAVSPNGQWMAVSTQFGVYLYDASRFGAAGWFTPLADKAGLVVFDPLNERLGVATGSDVVILDVVSGSVLARLKNAGGSFAWSPDGRRLVSGSGCQQVMVWNASDGAALEELSGDKCSEGYSGIKVTWAADGRIYGASMGTKIMAWDGESYAPVEGFSAVGAKDTWVSAILAAPAGNLLAHYDSMGLPIVAIIDGKQDSQLHLLDQQVNGPITALAWAQDGQHLAVAYGMNTGLILVWNAQTGQVEQKIEGLYIAVGLGWSADGKTLFGPQTLDGQINAIEVSTGKVLRSLSGHASAGSFLTWTMADNLVSTNGMTITRWADLTGEPLQQETVGSPQAAVISWPPSGPRIFLFTSLERGHQVGTLHSKWPLAGDNNQYPFPTAWSWDGGRLADPTHVWDVGSGKLLANLQDPAQQHTPDQVAWSPDGTRLVSADSLNMQFPVIWDSQTGKVLLTLPVESGKLRPVLLGLAWSPDGKKLAAVGSLMHMGNGLDDAAILVWDAETGQQEQLLTAGMEGYRLWAVTWSPDSRFLACGTTGSDLFVWNMVKGTPLARLVGHREITDRLAWSLSPDLMSLASVARDGTLQIWDLSSITSEYR